MFALILLGICAFYFAVMTIGWFGGWKRLCESSPNAKIEGTVIHTVSAGFWFGSYNRMLVASISPEGITCAFPVVLRLWYRPFTISWGKLAHMEPSWPFGYSTALIFNTEIGEVVIALPTRFKYKVKEAIAEYESSTTPAGQRPAGAA